MSSNAIQSLECEGYINGCTDEMACNFDVLATQNDGSCDTQIHIMTVINNAQMMQITIGSVMSLK